MALERRATPPPIPEDAKKSKREDSGVREKSKEGAKQERSKKRTDKEIAELFGESEEGAEKTGESPEEKAAREARIERDKQDARDELAAMEQKESADIVFEETIEERLVELEGGKQESFSETHTELPEHVATSGNMDEGLFVMSVGAKGDRSAALHADIAASTIASTFAERPTDVVTLPGLATGFEQKKAFDESRVMLQARRITTRLTPRESERELFEADQERDEYISKELTERMQKMKEVTEENYEWVVAERLLDPNTLEINKDSAEGKALLRMSYSERKKFVEQSGDLIPDTVLTKKDAEGKTILDDDGQPIEMTFKEALLDFEEIAEPSTTIIKIDQVKNPETGEEQRIANVFNAGKNKVLRLRKDGKVEVLVEPENTDPEGAGTGKVSEFVAHKSEQPTVEKGDKIIVIADTSQNTAGLPEMPTGTPIAMGIQRESPDDPIGWLEKNGYTGSVLEVK